MVVPVAALLVVTMFVAGNHNGKQEIKIEENSEELNITVPPCTTKPIEQVFRGGKTSKNSTTTVSYINGGKGQLNLTVDPHEWEAHIQDNRLDSFTVRVFVDGDIPSFYNPTDLKIKAKMIEAPDLERNHLDWSTSFMENKNGLKSWPAKKMKEGAMGNDESYIGYEINKNSFSTGGIFLENNRPPNYNLTKNPIEMKVQASLIGAEEVIKTSIYCSFTYRTNGVKL